MASSLPPGFRKIGREPSRDYMAEQSAEREAMQRSQKRAENSQQGGFQNFVKGIPLGYKKASSGMLELGLNAAQALGIDSIGGTDLPTYKSLLADTQREYDRQGEGTGVPGFLGEAVGDLKTYTPFKGNILMQGVKSGAMTGLLSPTGKEDSTLADNATQGATGAGIGAFTAPALAKPIEYGIRAPKWVYDTVRRTYSDDAAAKKAYNIMAKRLVDEGYQPGEVQSLIDEANSTGLKTTLGEATQSSGVLQAEKNVLRGTGKGANTMRSALADRARENVPETITKKSNELRAVAPIIDDLYSQAGKMGKDADISAPVKAAMKEIEARLMELGDVDTLEARALRQASSILRNTKPPAMPYYPGTPPSDIPLQQPLPETRNRFDTLLDAKRQLSDMYIDNADTYAQKKAQRFVAKRIKALDQALQEIGGEPYSIANRAAQQNMAGRDLADALDTSREGGLTQLYNKLWATPELRDDFLRKLPNDATRNEYTAFFGTLDKIRRGFGGSDTAFNIPAGEQLAAEAGLGVKPSSLNPMNLASTAADAIGEKLKGRTYEQTAKASLNPDQDALTTAMQKRLSNEPDGLTTATRTLGRAGTSIATRSALEAENRPAEPETKPAGSSLPPGFRKISRGGSFMDKVGTAESGGNPNAQSPTSSAKGTYGFTDKTWKDAVNKYGGKLGVKLTDRGVEAQEKKLGNQLDLEQSEALRNVLGRHPTEGERYVAWFAGTPNATRIYQAKPTALAKDVVLRPKGKDPVEANREIFYDGKRPRTVEEFLTLLENKV